VRVIPHGAFDYLTQLPEERPLPAELAAVERPVVLFFGLVRPYKGVDVLLRAFPRVHRETGARLVLVGDGPEREDLIARAAAVGVAERIGVTGWQEDARDYLSAIDVFVLPSRFEGFPQAVVEAMLAERPVVASDVGSVADAVVDGETGFLVAPGDVKELHERVAQLLGDRSLRDRMGANGRELVLERFTWQACADRCLDSYAELVP
jgi:glycosyltransferase involved in cell wall biosynthesis